MQAGAQVDRRRLSAVQAVTDRINGVAAAELRNATALVRLFSACIAPDSLAALVANRGSVATMALAAKQNAANDITAPGVAFYSAAA